MVLLHVEDEPVRASWLDRMVARIEIHPFFGYPMTISPLLSAALVPPVAIPAIVTGTSPFAVTTLIVVGLTMLVTLGEAARALWVRRNSYASPRWLHAVRAVVGDEVMERALANLTLLRGREPDYVLTRQDIVEQVRLVRRERRDAAKRARGVRLASEPDGSVA
ncbi:MAG TPA: hypothetical protein VF695_12515 [Sphingomonas sp.]